MKPAFWLLLCLNLLTPVSHCSTDVFVWAARVSSLSLTSTISLTSTTMLIDLMPEASGGSSCYTQVSTNVLIKSGIVEVQVGPALPDLSLCSYMEITFNGQLLTPRYKLAVLPMSVRASHAASAGNTSRLEGLTLSQITSQLSTTSASMAISSVSTQISALVTDAVASANTSINTTLTQINTSVSNLQTLAQSASAQATSAENTAQSALTTAQSLLSQSITNATTTAQSVVATALSTIPALGSMASQFSTSVNISGGQAQLASLSATNVQFTSAAMVSVSVSNNLSATTASIGTLNVTTLNLSNLTLPTITVTTSTAGTSNTTSLSAQTATITTLSVTSLNISTLSVPDLSSTSAAFTTASINLVKSNGIQLAPQTAPPTCNAGNAGLLILKQTAGPTFTFCACTGANYINIVSGAACP
ncbi:MAG: hypothetical protein H3C47_13510 [Candidatus Cloacimonetes bacterium]|nr:hypothetical protein [Candidatus Cloacimonadota bacterium]